MQTKTTNTTNQKIKNELSKETKELSKLNSRLSGFYELPINMRKHIVKESIGLTDFESKSLHNFGALTPELTDIFIENAIGTYNLPLGIATNFKINKKDILIPMAVEESSVLAAASHGAKLARSGGGFKTSSTAPIMTGQIQVFTAKSGDFSNIIEKHKASLLDYANKGQDRLMQRGGGAKDITWQYFEEIESLVLYLHVNTCDAMGANIVNTMCEKLSTFMPALFPNCGIGLRILTNLTDRRLAKASCTVTHESFNSTDFKGLDVVDRIVKAYKFAYVDPYRAATNNKGIMNGIDPVVIATGNDWRAVEAGAHAYASRSGQYRPMAHWSQTEKGDLYGEIELPMAVGTVGGVTKLHPTAQASLKVLGSHSGTELGEIICAVGLAQNLSALRALASEGIQKGHMSLHRRNLDLLKQGINLQ